MGPDDTVFLLLQYSLEHASLAMAHIHHPLIDQLDATLGTLDHYFNNNSTREGKSGTTGDDTEGPAQINF